MKSRGLLLIIAAVAALLLIAAPAQAGGKKANKPASKSHSQITPWLTMRYDAQKESGPLMPGQKDFRSWLVSGRCAWIEGMNVAAGYEVWAPNLDWQSRVRTARTGVTYNLDALVPSLPNKAAQIAVERSLYNNGQGQEETSYGAVAAFLMRF